MWCCTLRSLTPDQLSEGEISQSVCDAGMPQHILGTETTEYSDPDPSYLRHGLSVNGLQHCTNLLVIGVKRSVCVFSEFGF